MNTLTGVYLSKCQLMRECFRLWPPACGCGWRALLPTAPIEIETNPVAGLRGIMKAEGAPAKKKRGIKIDETKNQVTVFDNTEKIKPRVELKALKRAPPGSEQQENREAPTTPSRPASRIVPGGASDGSSDTTTSGKGSSDATTSGKSSSDTITSGSSSGSSSEKVSVREGSSDSRDSSDSGKMGWAFAGVALAVLSSGLVGTLGVVALRRRRSERRNLNAQQKKGSKKPTKKNGVAPADIRFRRTSRRRTTQPHTGNSESLASSSARDPLVVDGADEGKVVDSD
eukprot:GHVT01068132.1.p1 GENE.GHVT01068132.1~~GHVT01068132.1.p1  ORF type:complete len:285 (-),score=71.33 GHVT01068132.1:327-1181(-)